VRPEPPGQVTVAGLFVLFPENVGVDSANVEVCTPTPDGPAWATAAGHLPIDASGEFGPVRERALAPRVAIVGPTPAPTIAPSRSCAATTSCGSTPAPDGRRRDHPDSDVTANLPSPACEFWLRRRQPADRRRHRRADAATARALGSIWRCSYTTRPRRVTDIGKGELFLQLADLPLR
jgi:hypothetical protein